MKIDRITLQGFKSFGERTHLDFGPGVFGIVGPNGSGKSNIVEGLRWAVGARAKELRGDEALSLIFHGSDGKAPGGFAEVGLEVSKDKERLNVSRRLDKDATSEVRLNGSKTTLKNVEHNLMGTGLSRTGYAVVGQGEIGQILQAGPEVLLSYLEEAAGLKAVTQASKLAGDRLESARAEFGIRNAEMEERRESIASKAVQANEAKRAGELASKVVLYRRSAIHARIREAESDANAAKEKARVLGVEKDQVSTRLTAIEAEKRVAMENLDGAQNVYSEALRQAEALSGDLKLVEQERAQSESLLSRLSRDIGESDTRLVRLRSATEPTAPTDPEPSQEVSSELETKHSGLNNEIRDFEGNIRQAQQAFERFLQEQAGYEAKRTAFVQATQEKASLEQDLLRLNQDLELAEKNIAGAESREKELRAALNELVSKEGSLNADARAADSEAGRLEAMVRSGSDLAEGPKKARDSKIPGIIGVVADLLRVDAKLDLAMEVALGVRLQWVLTETEGAAQKAIEFLKADGGRATFLPKTLLRGSGRNRDWKSEPGVVGLARELVKLSACPEALHTLLGDTVIVQNMDAALAIGRKFSDSPRIVTLEGELLETNGALTGGKTQRGGQMLALRRRFEEARIEAVDLAREANVLREQSDSVRFELTRLELDTLRRKSTEISAEIRSVQNRINSFASLAEPVAPIAVAAPDSSGLEGLRASRDEVVRQLSGEREISSLWKRFREDMLRFRDAQVQLEETSQRLDNLRKEQIDIAAKLSDLQQKKDDLEAKRQMLGVSDLEAKLNSARYKTRDLADEESRLLVRSNQIGTDLESQNVVQARREATIETLQTELAEVPEGPVEEGSARGLSRILTEAEAELATIGPVNHLAEREYELLSTDIIKLEEALTESMQAVNKLEDELLQVQMTYQGKMDGVFVSFCEKFSEYAGVLLSAEVQLERGEKGLDLVLKPAGKRTVNLNLLSMGERTMGALAFLFALSEVGEGGGFPIAVLDEVDAPLDDANIQRFCKFIRTFSKQTQFILVTHQKRTMEACDALYGVTTDKGVSKIFSIKKEEVGVQTQGSLQL